ncbi:hypothetical protein DPMN_100721 [Dreissena polymorpha]|uniref:Reverse transcriptase domain-containing protein n=1 Tax=Dreissena polymorpha TaxID=45954 RepID=A0A9D4LIP3_DREPO|nr:hypothetical protein DPMN_100721 [Dreissena polymorpha]
MIDIWRTVYPNESKFTWHSNPKPTIFWCPLSSSLFIICIEYLSHYIQSNKHIKGISLESDEEIKQSLFAEDATYFSNDSSDSFNNLIESLTPIWNGIGP